MMTLGLKVNERCPPGCTVREQLHCRAAGTFLHGHRGSIEQSSSPVHVCNCSAASSNLLTALSLAAGQTASAESGQACRQRGRREAYTAAAPETSPHQEDRWVSKELQPWRGLAR